MSMPAGYKSEHGYFTVNSVNGLGYREIADKMTSQGYKMNHSTARNLFMSAMEKFAIASCTFYGKKKNSECIKKISNDPRFQSGIYDIIREISI